MEMKHNMNSWLNLLTKIVLSLGLRQRIKDLINVIIDMAIQEGKEEIDITTVFSAEEKVVAKNGVDLVAAKLKTLINERM